MNTNLNDTKINQINEENPDLLNSPTFNPKIDLNSNAKQDKKQEAKIPIKKNNKLLLSKISSSNINSRRASMIQSIMHKKQNNNNNNTNNNQNLNSIKDKSLQFLQINLFNKIKEMQNNKKLLEESEGNTNKMISESINKNRSNDFLLKEKNTNNITDKLEKRDSEIIKSTVGETNTTQKLNTNTEEKAVISAKPNRKLKGNIIIREEFRFLERKNIVYDSVADDTTDNDEYFTDENFYISPHNSFLDFFDLIILVSTLYNLVIFPVNLSMSLCVNKYHYTNIINYSLDIIYIIDFILCFFRAYYNFVEKLVTNNKKIFLNYLSNYFFIDLICIVPFFSIFKYLDKNNNNCFHNLSFNYILTNLHTLFELLKIFKIFKVIDRQFNKATKKLIQLLDDLYFGYAYFFIIKVFLMLSFVHLTACIHIFISRNSYPSWINNLKLNNSSFLKIHVTSIYFIITTVTSVGYGDITGNSINEVIFQIILLIFGIFAYSWAVSALSNYIHEKNKLREVFEKKIKILDDIHLQYQNMPKELYGKIFKHLEYTYLSDSKDKEKLIETLPFTIKNNLLNEMYKPIISNLHFFKNFNNSSFILKIVPKLVPILAYKNDVILERGEIIEQMILVKNGRIALEIKIDINNPEESIDNLLNDDKFFGIGTVNELAKNKLYYIYNDKENIPNNEIGYEKVNTKSTFAKEDDETPEYLRLKILDIRKNEHFGGLLMFLNKRSPLSLRVRSVKAELLFLKKIDAIQISSSYPNIWKRVNKVSFYNLKQISKNMKKIILQYCDTIGLKFECLERKNTLNFKEEIQTDNSNSVSNTVSNENSNINNENNINNTKLEVNNNNQRRKPIMSNKEKSRPLKKFFKNMKSLSVINPDINNLAKEFEQKLKLIFLRVKKNSKKKNRRRQSCAIFKNASSYCLSPNKKRKKRDVSGKIPVINLTNLSNLKNEKKNNNPNLNNTNRSIDIEKKRQYVENIKNYLETSGIIKTERKNITSSSKTDSAHNVKYHKNSNISIKFLKNNYEKMNIKKLSIFKNENFELKSSYTNINNLSKNKFIKDKNFQEKIKKIVIDNYDEFKISKKKTKKISYDYQFFKIDKNSNKVVIGNEPIRALKTMPKRNKSSNDFKISLKLKKGSDKYEKCNAIDSFSPINCNQQNRCNTINKSISECKSVMCNIVSKRGSKNKSKTKKISFNSVGRKNKNIKSKKKLFNVIDQSIINNSNMLNNPNQFYCGLFNNIIKDNQQNKPSYKDIKFSNFSGNLG